MWVTLTLPLTGSLIPRVNPDCKRIFKKTVCLLVWDGRWPSWAQYDLPTDGGPHRTQLSLPVCPREL